MFFGNLAQRRTLCNGGICEDDIELAGLFCDGSDDTVDVIGPGNIGGDRNGRLAKPRDCIVQLFLPPSDQKYGCAFIDELLRGGQADAACSAKSTSNFSSSIFLSTKAFGCALVPAWVQ